MIMEPDTGEVLGWISWYCFDQDSLEKVKEFGLPGCFYQNEKLLPGSHVYFSNAVIREGAGKRTFRTLWSMALKANQDAESHNAHLWNRDTPVWRWFTRSVKRKSVRQEVLQ